MEDLSNFQRFSFVMHSGSPFSEKRAYLAKFCMNLEAPALHAKARGCAGIFLKMFGEVPEEFLREEQVYSSYQNYKDRPASLLHQSLGK